MAAYKGGCAGRGTTATFCVCLCHVVRNAECDEKSCIENGKGRVRVPFFSTAPLHAAPAFAMVSDHTQTTPIRHINRQRRGKDMTKRAVRRALRRH